MFRARCRDHWACPSRVTKLVSKCADRLIDAWCEFNESIQLGSLQEWIQEELESLRALAVRLSSSVQACQIFLDAHQKVGPLLDRAVKQLAVERDCERALQLAQTNSKFANEDTETAAGKEKPLATARVAAQKQLCSLKQQLHALTLIAPELVTEFSKLGLGADSPLVLLTVERAFSDDYENRRSVTSGALWRRRPAKLSFSRNTPRTSCICWMTRSVALVVARFW
jgi:hypothetical protein